MTVVVRSLTHGSGWCPGRHSQTVLAAMAGGVGLAVVGVDAVGVAETDGGVAVVSDCPEHAARLTAARTTTQARRTS